MTNYIDTWHMCADIGESYKLTCYGIKDEAKARAIAATVAPLASHVEIVRTTKTFKGHFRREVIVIKE